MHWKLLVVACAFNLVGEVKGNAAPASQGSSGRLLQESVSHECSFGCTQDSDCDEGLLCSNNHLPELASIGFDSRAQCDFLPADDPTYSRVCFHGLVLPRTNECGHGCSLDSDCDDGLLCSKNHLQALSVAGFDSRGECDFLPANDPIFSHVCFLESILVEPTDSPSNSPTKAPTVSPTGTPTIAPSPNPTASPTTTYCAGSKGSGELTVSLLSQAGGYRTNGDVLAEVVGSDGGVALHTLTTNYVGNIGRTFRLNLDEGDIVRIGIRVNGGRYLWATDRKNAIASDVNRNTARFFFEDQGEIRDFDDLVVRATVTGKTLLQCPDGVTLSKSNMEELLTNPYYNGGSSGWTILNPSGGAAPLYGGTGVNVNRGWEDATGDGVEQTVTTVSGEIYLGMTDVRGRDGKNGVSHTVVLELVDKNSGAILATDTTIVEGKYDKRMVIAARAISSSTTLRVTNPFGVNEYYDDLVVSGGAVVGPGQTPDPCA